jgi:hypothetical protein
LDLKYLSSEQRAAEWLSVENSIGLERMKRRPFIWVVVVNEVEERRQMLRVDIKIVNIIDHLAAWSTILPFSNVAHVFTRTD